VVTAIDNFCSHGSRAWPARDKQGRRRRPAEKTGDAVEHGQPLYRVHAEFNADFKFARAFAEHGSGYSVGAAADIPQFSEFNCSPLPHLR